MSDIDFLTEKETWDKYHDAFKPKKLMKVGFYDIFSEYLTPDASKTVIEIGCGGGRHLCWLAMKYGFKPFGIEYTDKGIENAYKIFEFHDLEKPQIQNVDFFNWKPDRKFDVVCSFGFVEHFEDFNSVVKLHCDLVKPAGMLIITMPHLAHLNYYWWKLLFKERLENHNTKIMNLKSVKKALSSEPFEILHLNYYRTFWMPAPEPGFSPGKKIVYHLISRTGRRIRKTIGRKRPNRLISPHIVCVARKNADAE